MTAQRRVGLAPASTRSSGPEPAPPQRSPAGRGIVVFVAGTGTAVGKTWAAAGLAKLLRDAGLVVAACKPVQSHDPDESGPTDAAVLAAATGQDPDEVCPPDCTFPVPLAPPMAARRLGRACPAIDGMASNCRFAPTVDVGLVEGVGGLYSPIASDGHNLDLIERIQPDLVVVVASADLGGIHDTMACTLPLAAYRLAVYCNRFDPRTEVHGLNARWLRDVGLDVAVSLPELAAMVA